MNVNADIPLPEAEEDPNLEIDLREHFPAANPAQDTYTMLKFYNLRTELIKSVLEGLDDAKIDFPFRVSPSEQRIIEMEAPTSIILVGEQLAQVLRKLDGLALHLARHPCTSMLSGIIDLQLT